MPVPMREKPHRPVPSAPMDSDAPKTSGRLFLGAVSVIGIVVLGLVGLFLLGSTSEPAAPDGPAAAPPPTAARNLSTPPKRSFYVARNGSAGAEGSLSSPLDLASVLSVNTPAAPGDTIWLRGGTYVGPFTSELRGTESDPIVVRALPGERATIQAGQLKTAALTVNGEWTWYVDLEITNAQPFRTDNGTTPGLRPDVGVLSHGAHIKFINLVVHDLAGGIDLSADAEDNEAYGNLVFYNGWQGKDVGEGFGIRTPNREGPRLIRENVIFNQFSVGILGFGADVRNLELRGNVLFNNGQLSPFFDRHILVGGGSSRIVVTQNMTYYTSEKVNAEGINLGLNGGCVEARVTENYLTGGSPLNLTNCRPTTMRNNTLHGLVNISEKTYPGNILLSTTATPAPTMTGVKVFVRPSEYDRGRATIVIYNWSKVNDVSVDLSNAGLTTGTNYRLRDAQDYFGRPITTFTYSGARLSVPMTTRELAKPVGTVTRTPTHTAPEFAVFVVVPESEPAADAAAASKK